LLEGFFHRSPDLAANNRVTVIRDRRGNENREFMKIATESRTSRIALGNFPAGLHATEIEHYLNNCYVCILSAIIPIDVNSVNISINSCTCSSCVEYLYQNLIDRILSNLIPKFSNSYLEPERVRGLQTDMSARQNGSQVATKGRTFSKLLSCVLSPLILTLHQA